MNLVCSVPRPTLMIELYQGTAVFLVIF